MSSAATRTCSTRCWRWRWRTRKRFAAFDRAFRKHVRHAVANAGRAAVRSWSGSRIGPAPEGAGPVAAYYRRLSRYAASLALLSDLALLALGGSLKRKELISGRLSDVLPELYLLSAVLKRSEDEGRQDSDLPLVEWCMEAGFASIEGLIEATLRSLPVRPLAWLTGLIVQPVGPTRHGPDDAVVKRCAELLLEPSEARERLTAGVYCGGGGEGIALLSAPSRLSWRRGPSASGCAMPPRPASRRPSRAACSRRRKESGRARRNGRLPKPWRWTISSPANCPA